MLKNNDIALNQKLIIAEIKRVKNEFFENRKMTIQMFRKHSTVKFYKIIKYCKTWDNALKQAEINHSESYTNTILADVRRVYFQYYENTRMTIENYSLYSEVHHTTIYRHLGSWDDALNQANINVLPRGKRLDDDEVIAELKRVYFKYFQNARMTRVDFTFHSGIKNARLKQQFESWDDALDCANINFNPDTLPSDQKRTLIMADLQRIKASNNNQYFNYIVYKQNRGRYVFNEILELFECKSWQLLMDKKLALLKYKMVYTEKELYDELKRVWKIYRRRPTYEEFRVKSNIKMSVYEKTFFNWTLCIEKFCLNNRGYKSSENGINFKTTDTLL